MRLLRYLPRFQQAYRQLDELAARESWSRSDIEALQLERLNRVWRHVSEHTPFYQALRTRLHLPDLFSSLDEFRGCMPILAKSDVARNPDDFLARPAQRGQWYRTSGSTGTPLSIFQSHVAHREMLRARYRFYAMWGHDIFDRMVWLWNTHDTSAPGLAGQAQRTVQPLVDRLRNRLRLSAHRLGKSDLQGYLQRIERFRPSAMYGLSRAIGLLAHEAHQRGFACPTLRFVSLTGETAPSNLVASVEGAFHVPALLEYGSIEIPCIANEWPDRTLRIREDLVLVETIEQGAGIFDLVLTVLANPAFALLRYRIGDITSAPVTVPPRGFCILSNVTGRSDDVLRTKSGRYLHPSFIDSVLERESRLAIRRYQVHQSADGSVRVALEIDGTPCDAAMDNLQKVLGRTLDGYPVSVQRVEWIAQTAAGKHRLITSDLRPLRHEEPEARETCELA